MSDTHNEADCVDVAESEEPQYLTEEWHAMMKERFIDAYKRHGGNINACCRELDINRKIYYDNWRQDVEFILALGKTIEEAIPRKDVNRFTATDIIDLGVNPGSNDKLLQKKFLELLPRNDFSVKRTLREVGVSDKRYYQNWRKDDQFLMASRALKQELVDFFVENLCSISKDKKRGMPAVTATMFGLKCVGKEDGWDERSGVNINVNNSGVMVVPMQIGAEDWEKAASAQQNNLIQNVEKKGISGGAIDIDSGD